MRTWRTSRPAWRTTTRLSWIGLIGLSLLQREKVKGHAIDQETPIALAHQWRCHAYLVSSHRNRFPKKQPVFSAVCDSSSYMLLISLATCFFKEIFCNIASACLCMVKHFLQQEETARTKHNLYRFSVLKDTPATGMANEFIKINQSMYKILTCLAINRLISRKWHLCNAPRKTRVLFHRRPQLLYIIGNSRKLLLSLWLWSQEGFFYWNNLSLVSLSEWIR